VPGAAFQLGSHHRSRSLMSREYLSGASMGHEHSEQGELRWRARRREKQRQALWREVGCTGSLTCA
jgi:hypothetical protein